MIDIEFSNEQTYFEIERKYKIEKDKNKNFNKVLRRGELNELD